MEKQGQGPSGELARWNERFTGAGYHFGTEPNAFLASQITRLKEAASGGASALCVADGEGRNGVWLAQQGLSVTSFDFSPVAVAKAREPARYDVIAGIFVQFATPPGRARMFAGMCRALNPGGLLLLQGYRPEQIAYGTGGPSRPEQLYTSKLLKQAFGALDILELREHDDEIGEGTAHVGMSALIDLVARRPA